MAVSREKASKKELFGWALFDFANSAYTTVIISVVFVDIFIKMIVGPDDASAADPEYRRGNNLWILAQVISFSLVVITAPIFGAITDYRAGKKKFLFASYLITIIGSIGLYFVLPGFAWLGVVLIAISNFGFASGENFVSSILPDLGPPEELGKISGYAWGLGYFGGLISTILAISLGDATGDQLGNLVYVGPLTGVFFLVAGIPTFLWVKNRGQAKPLPEGENLMTIGFKRLRHTFNEAKSFRDLMAYLIAWFFAMAGLSIVISFAFTFGTQVIKWDASAKTLMFIITQLTAALGAVSFGLLQDKIGSKKAFNISLVLWAVTIVLIYSSVEITELVNGIFGTDYKVQTIFVCIGSLAGMGLGATQSSSRALVGILSPDSKSGEFFGLWGFSMKLASIVGLLGLGVLQSMFGLKVAILLCSVFFIISLLVMTFVNEKRGRQAAEDYTDTATSS